MPEEQRSPLLVIAEDNPGDVYLVREALAEQGMTVELHTIDDGGEVLRWIESLDADDAVPCPDVLLLDLNLPKHGGDEILARLRRTRRCSHTPVVILTSSDNPRDRARADELGVTHYFRKPADLEEFLKLGSVLRTILA